MGALRIVDLYDDEREADDVDSLAADAEARALMAPGDVSKAPSPLDLLDRLLDRPKWHADAACRARTDLDWQPGANDETSEAVALCASCPVRVECLQAALDGRETGLWAGTTTSERAALIDDRPRPIVHGRRATYLRGCRCADCRAAATAYRAAWRAERRRAGKRWS
jgi:hypothetical protein